MAGEVAERQTKDSQGGLRRKMKRVSIRIDMTPMVDVAFLLLIFFMVTTVFRQPQAMEMNLPPPDTTVKVMQSNVLTLFVDAKDRMFWQVGDGTITQTALKDLHTLFIEHSKLNPSLIILVKLDRTAPYNDMVNVMDELEIANMQKFSLIPMTDEESHKIEAHL